MEGEAEEAWDTSSLLVSIAALAAVGEREVEAGGGGKGGGGGREARRGGGDGLGGEVVVVVGGTVHGAPLVTRTSEVDGGVAKRG